MSDANTARVLVLPGGGMKGYMSNRFLARFIQTWGIDQADLWKYFDVIAGTSIGGISALAYAYGKTPDELASFFTDDGPWVFTNRNSTDVALGSNNASTPNNRPDASQRLTYLITNGPFYESVSDTSNYGTAKLKSTISAQFGTDTMQNLKTNVLIPSYQYDTNTAILFSNLNFPGYSGQNESLYNVALATSAAPVYFPLITLDDAHIYADGGLCQNDPAFIAYIMARRIKPTANRFCVMSLGTGVTHKGSSQTFHQNILDLIAIGVGGDQDVIENGMSMLSEYVLSNLSYYQFQPTLDTTLSTDLDNADTDFLEYLADTAESTFNDDIVNITNFLGKLTA